MASNSFTKQRELFRASRLEDKEQRWIEREAVSGKEGEERLVGIPALLTGTCKAGQGSPKHLLTANVITRFSRSHGIKTVCT